MALDLNVSPYYNDFDPDKQFEKVLFKPGVAVQARELTQLQSYLSNAIKNHAGFNLSEGARVSGGEGTILRKPYIKVNDIDASGTTIDGNTLANYVGDTVTGSVTGIKAKILSVVDGSDADAVDKKTFYLAYIGGNPTEAGSLENSLHFDAGETLTVTSDVTDRDGDTFVVDNNTSTTVIENNYYGYGFFFVIADGVFFLKDQFVTHLRQELRVDKYNPNQSCYIGLRVKESIVTSDDDTSLLDPASGTFNYNAPGADRYKVYTVMDYKGIDEDGDDEFVATDKIIEGKYFQKVPEDVGMLSEIGKILAQRTREESGDYVTKKFDIQINEHLNTGTNDGKYRLTGDDVVGDASKLAVSVGGGTAYVGGYRIAKGTSIVLEADKGIDTFTQEGQIVSTGYGNYFIVDNFAGTWNIKDGDMISIHDQVKSAASGGTYGSTSAPTSSQTIGQARVKHIAHHSGTIGSSDCQYKVYVYDIKITKGVLEDARGIYYSNSTDSGFGDLILNADGNAEVKERNQNRLVFPNPFKNTKTLAAAGGGTYDTQFYYQEEYDVTFTGLTGVASISTTGTSQFPYSASPTQTIVDQNMVLIATQACTINSTVYAEGQVIPLTSSMITGATSTSLSFTLGVTLGSFTAKLFVNVVNTDSTPVPKNLVSDIYVKIDTSTNSGGQYGPWNLGIPDVFKIQGVWVGSTYAEEGQDQKSKFLLKSGQTDNLYGHSKLTSITGSTVASGSKILVKLSCFEPNYTVTDGTWFAADSYPVDDTGTGGIYTYEIPVYKSDFSGQYNLRDCIDFRPYVVATATTNTPNISDATENPPVSGQVNAPADGLQIPNPVTNFSTDVECYLPRIDNIVLTETGDLLIVKGMSAKNPRPPVVEYGMKLAELTIPAFPSISPFLGKLYRRPDLTVGRRLLQTRRYTMADINAIERRIKRLEYYTALSLMEREADSMKILDSEGNDRFKNGIFINAFTSHSLSAVTDPGFRAALDIERKKINPYYYEENVNLVYNPTSSTGIQQTGPLLTLPYTNVVFSQNRFSSKSRNCVGELLFDWYGDLELFPRSSNYVNTSEAPDLWRYDNSLANFAGELANAVNSAQIVSSYELSFAGVPGDPITRSFRAEGEATTDFSDSDDFSTSASDTASASDRTRRVGVQADATASVDITGTTTIDGSVTTTGVLTGDVVSQTETITASATTKLLTASSSVVGSQEMYLGSKLISVDINTFMSPNAILCLGNRLKPNTKMYGFFDNVAQNQNIIPVDVDAALHVITTYPEDEWAWRALQNATGWYGDTPTTDDQGRFACIYQIPGSTFITGDKLLRFVDDVKNRKAMITCSCDASYTSFGLSTVSQETVISTQIPNISFGQTRGTPSTVGSWTHVTGTEITNLALEMDSTSNIEVTTELDSNLDLQLHLEVTGGFDPIAQTFTVNSNEGIFATQVKVFFRNKSSTEGITLQLREVVNGYPAKTILPYGESYLSPSEVNVTTEDADGYVNFVDTGGNSLATTFEFRSPVYLKGGAEYCFVLLPAGNSPDYDIWVSELGQNKINTNQRIFAEDTNIDGILFTSSNNRTWNAHQAEDITYQLVRASFSTTAGTAKFTNEDVDWLKTTNYSGGRPEAGQQIHGWNATIVNTGSNYEAGDIITLESATPTSWTGTGSAPVLTDVQILVTAPAVGAPGPISDFEVLNPGTLPVQWPSSNPGVMAQSSITASDIGSGTSSAVGTNATFSLDLCRGRCKDMDVLNEVCTVSVVDGYFRDQTTGTIITPLGTGSTRYFEVEEIQDKKYNQLRTTLSAINLKDTTLDISYAPTKSSGVGSAGNAYTPIALEARQNVAEEMAVRSYSNEDYFLTGASTKTFNNNIVFRTTNEKTSPVIDTTRNSMLIKRNDINNDATGEEGNNGNALSKFINKPVVLATGMEAQDILVQVALKQPIGTEIKVYGKFLSPEDDADFIEDIEWIELERNDDFSPSTAASSTTQFIDYGFGIPDTYLDGDAAYYYETDRVTEITLGTGGSGYTSAPTLTFDSGKATGYAILSGTSVGSLVLTSPGRDYTSTPNVIVGTEFENLTSYATGQQVFYGANLYTVNVGGTTDASTFPTHTSGTVTIGTTQITYAGQAATVTASVNTVTFKGFKKFSTKLVMLSNNTSAIPEAKELRCIAMQAPLVP